MIFEMNRFWAKTFDQMKEVHNTVADPEFLLGRDTYSLRLRHPFLFLNL